VAAAQRESEGERNRMVLINEVHLIQASEGETRLMGQCNN
jgi:hypothetical protein